MLRPIVFAALLSLAPHAKGAALFDVVSTARPKAVSTGTLSRREVRVHPEALAARTLRLDLSPIRADEGVVERAYSTARGDRVIKGTLRGVPGSSFLVLAHGDEVAGDFEVSFTERYRLRRSAGGTPELRRVDAKARVHCAENEVRAAPVKRERAEAHASPAVADDPTQYDAVIVYTPAARVAAGGTEAIETEAALAIESVNAAYANSGINTRARLVHTAEIAYVESGSALTDLNRLTDPIDGFMDEVPSLRDAWHADVVSLFVDHLQPGVAGIANLAVFYNGGELLAEQEKAFSIVEADVASPHMLAHEIGHNFGCQHDLQNAAVGTDFFAYGYGWRFIGADGVLYHTVMSYDPGQAIPYFSSPLIPYQGVPTGVDGVADNARVINENAAVVANFRPQRLSEAIAAGTVGQAFAYQAPVESSPTVYSAEGLPTELTIDPATGNITGIPVAAGVSAATVTASNEFGVFPLALAITVTPAQLAEVNIAASIPQAMEAGRKKGEFTVTRSGNTSAELVVAYSIKGTAVAGVNFKAIGGQTTILAGNATASIRIKPIEDGVRTGKLKVKLTLQPGDGFQVGADATAKVTIVDED